MADHAPRKILIVDDEEVVRRVCQRVLEPLGYEVHTAGDGGEALECLDRGFYDLMITDVRMPGQWNGLSLAQEVKRRSAQTQVVVMTAFPDTAKAVDTLRLGGFDFIIKPFERTELVQSVEACFERYPAA